MSPKNKGRNKAPITDPDEFISSVQSAADRLRPYAPHLVLGAGVILLVALALAIYSWVIDRRASAATESFASVVDVTGEMVGMPMPTPQGGMMEPGFETSEERAEEALSRLETFREEHDSADLASRSVLLEGRLLLDLERYDEARRAFELAAEGEGPEIARVLAREGIGYAHEGEALAAEDEGEREGALEGALSAFEGMQPDPGGAMRAHALYHQGRILLELGSEDEAVARLEEARQEAGGSVIELEIEERLAQLDAAPEEPAGEADAALEAGEPLEDPGAAPPPQDGAGAPTEP